MTAAQEQLPLASPKPATVTTRTVLEALVDHYRKPGEERSGEILITEAQAPGSIRRADLVRIGTWQSRGTGVDVHEIKVSRSDWLRELDDPAKAEAWWPYCNRFWITAPPGIVAPAELPPDWGLMELPLSGRRFKVKVPAARKEARLTVPLVIELLRRNDNDRLAQIGRLREEHRSEMYRAEHQWEVKRAEAQIPYEVKERLVLLERIEAALGAKLDVHPGWPRVPVSRVTPEELAAFLIDVSTHATIGRRREDLERDRAALQQAAETVAKRLSGWEAS